MPFKRIIRSLLHSFLKESRVKKRSSKDLLISPRFVECGKGWKVGKTLEIMIPSLKTNRDKCQRKALKCQIDIANNIHVPQNLMLVYLV